MFQVSLQQNWLKNAWWSDPPGSAGFLNIIISKKSEFVVTAFHHISCCFVSTILIFAPQYKSVEVDCESARKCSVPLSCWPWLALPPPLHRLRSRSALRVSDHCEHLRTVLFSPCVFEKLVVLVCSCFTRVLRSI